MQPGDDTRQSIPLGHSFRRPFDPLGIRVGALALRPRLPPGLLFSRSRRELLVPPASSAVTGRPQSPRTDRVLSRRALPPSSPEPSRPERRPSVAGRHRGRFCASQRPRKSTSWEWSRRAISPASLRGEELGGHRPATVSRFVTFEPTNVASSPLRAWSSLQVLFSRVHVPHESP